LDAIEEQKKENSEILLQLKSLQDAVERGGEGVTGKVNKNIPYSLSVKGVVLMQYLIKIYLQEMVRETHECKANYNCICKPIYYF